jgi:acyl-ACP thioesterase
MVSGKPRDMDCRSRFRMDNDMYDHMNNSVYYYLYVIHPV